MPGRLAIFDDSSFKNEARKIFTDVKNRLGIITPNYNTAPTHLVPVLLNTKQYTYAHFGLIPSWAKDKKNININARSETLFEKKSFRDSFKSKRCLIPVNGFYEWKKKDKEKIPYLVKAKNGDCFALAGLWDEWFDEVSGKLILSIALITVEPNDMIITIHDRMPVILDKENWKIWLDNDSSLDELNKLFKSYSSENMQMYEVSSFVNAVSNNNDICIKEKEKTGFSNQTLF